MDLNLFNIESTEDYEYLLSQMGVDVTINDSSIKTNVLIASTNLNENDDDKIITSLFPLNRGDLIDYNGKKYMVISQVNNKRYNRYKAIMRHLPFNITFALNCLFYTVYAYIDSTSFGVTNGNIVQLANGNIHVNIPANDTAKKLSIDNRFMVDGQAFKIVGIDKYSKKGIYILECQKDSLSATDDLENNIAGGLACTVDITNTEPVEVYEGATFQLIFTSASNAPVIFESSNSSIATVNASGLVTGVSVGNVTITIRNATRNVISDSITLNVIPAPAAYSINIVGSTTVTQSSTESYRADVYRGATLDSSELVTWAIFEDNKTTVAKNVTLTTTGNQTCTVKCTAYDLSTRYKQLRATLNSDNSIVAWLRIYTKSIY